MSLHETPSGERVHIGFFGLMNVGKSSLINAVTNQDLSMVSEIPGTTTDPVRKSMEILPLGPVTLIDTAGLDDSGALGELRVKRARRILDEVDIAVLVTEAGRELLPAETEMIALFREKGLQYLVAYNKADLLTDSADDAAEGPGEIYVSALNGMNIHAFRERLGDFVREKEKKKRVIVTDLLSPGETVVLVIPIDESAPKGRLILPQQQVMRELLDAHYSFITCQPEEIPQALRMSEKGPALVITDSQAFESVSIIVPGNIRLTSFSILFARYKGFLQTLVNGADMLGRLQDGDPVLISEGCTHHRQCNDIGTVKLPGWIRQYCGANPRFDFTSGRDFPADLSAYRLIVHCGGCMLNEQEMRSRMASARRAGVPVVNYGIAIAQMNGILGRSLEPFPEMSGTHRELCPV